MKHDKPVLTVSSCYFRSWLFSTVSFFPNREHVCPQRWTFWTSTVGLSVANSQIPKTNEKPQLSTAPRVQNRHQIPWEIAMSCYTSPENPWKMLAKILLDIWFQKSFLSIRLALCHILSCCLQCAVLESTRLLCRLYCTGCYKNSKLDPALVHPAVTSHNACKNHKSVPNYYIILVLYIYIYVWVKTVWT